MEDKDKKGWSRVLDIHEETNFNNNSERILLSLCKVNDLIRNTMSAHQNKNDFTRKNLPTITIHKFCGK